jgi:DNA invertase Pin-like site-specific DNA recombinase
MYHKAPKMNIAIYTRISTDHHNQTNENQKFLLIQYAESNGWKYDVYEEVESSRGTRPVKAHVLDKLRKGQYDGILVYKLDRYARSTSELILEVTELTKKGISFISFTEKLDFNSPTGRLHFQLLCAFCEFERETIRTRTIDALKRLKAKQEKEGVQILGRPKGSKDKKKRDNEGYLLREAKKRVANNTPHK